MDTVASHPILAIKTVLSLLEEKGTVEQQLHVLGQLAHLVQQLHDLNSEITTEVNGLPGLFAGLFGEVPLPRPAPRLLRAGRAARAASPSSPVSNACHAIPPCALLRLLCRSAHPRCCGGGRV